VIRWYLDGTRLAQLAADNRIGGSTAYRYLHEGIDVLAALARDLATAISAAKPAGHGHLNLDGTVIRADMRTATNPARLGCSPAAAPASPSTPNGSPSRSPTSAFPPPPPAERPSASTSKTVRPRSSPTPSASTPVTMASSSSPPAHLLRWIRKRYRRLRTVKKAIRAYKSAVRTYPAMFRHGPPLPNVSPDIQVAEAAGRPRS
jgi:hypothetical protein